MDKTYTVLYTNRVHKKEDPGGYSVTAKDILDAAELAVNGINPEHYKDVEIFSIVEDEQAK